MTTHPLYIQTLDAPENTMARMIKLIERHAPRFMRCGGGAVGGNGMEKERIRKVRITDRQRVDILALARTGEYSPLQIERLVDVPAYAVARLCRKHGVRAKGMKACALGVNTPSNGGS